jgi:hypothetical protein
VVAEGYIIIAPDGSRYFPNTVFGNLQRFCHHQLISFGLSKEQRTSETTAAASYPPPYETTCVLTDLPLHTLASLCALLADLPHAHNIHTHTPPPSHHTIHTHSHIVHKPRSRTYAGGEQWWEHRGRRRRLSCTRLRCPS